MQQKKHWREKLEISKEELLKLIFTAIDKAYKETLEEIKDDD